MRKSKIKLYVVDAAMLFLAINMTICINADKDQKRERADTSYKMVAMAEEKDEPQQYASTSFGSAEPTEAAMPTEAVVIEEETELKYQSRIGSMDWNQDETYMLAKIAMAEAENQDTEGKALVILTVLNRVWDSRFPNSIQEVIFQKNQFSPIRDGRYDKVEPDQDCYAALALIQVQHWDGSQGALYFESRSDSKWHSENLKFLFKHGDHYFYTERED